METEENNKMDWENCAGNILEELAETEKLNTGNAMQSEIHSFSNECGAIYTILCC